MQTISGQSSFERKPRSDRFIICFDYNRITFLRNIISRNRNAVHFNFGFNGFRLRKPEEKTTKKETVPEKKNCRTHAIAKWQTGKNANKKKRNT